MEKLLFQKDKECWVRKGNQPEAQTPTADVKPSTQQDSGALRD
ncbi:MAG TPA: hypothetical protein VJ729_08500 [Nitrososphaeraceae archaeon]|nr:hypothetical protein [Nitrososphaeraceae archaeon]